MHYFHRPSKINAVLLALLLFTSIDAAELSTTFITTAYCEKAGISSPAAREVISTFVRSVSESGLLTNLVDFAFFAEGQNVTVGSPVSLNNNGIIVGTVSRIPGGYEFANKSANNGMCFTNLPPTPAGRTLVVWGAPSYYPNISNNVNNSIFELTGPGSIGETLNPVCSFYAWWTPRPYFFNGAQHEAGAGHPNTRNSFFVASLSSGPLGCEGFFHSDYPDASSHFIGLYPVSTSPSVMRFAYRNTLANTNCGWLGVIRGFAYFDKALGTNEVLGLDQSVPRVGLVIDGDSKTVSNPWPQFWCETPNTWGLYSILTNAAVSGALIAAVNTPGYYNTMEHRWPSISHYRPNSKFPRIVYTVRGGHNDFGGENVAQWSFITNAFNAATNLWTKARAIGYTTVGWTVDRTETTWSPGNTNMLKAFNGLVREHATYCDYLMDAETWFVANFGETPYENPQVYWPSQWSAVHETALGGELLGRQVGAIAAVGLPAPSFRLVPERRPYPQGGCAIEVTGAPAQHVRVYSSEDLHNWTPLTNLTTQAGWAQFDDPESSMIAGRYYKAEIIGD